MSGGAPLAHSSNLIYVYDGSLQGFYCCVYESIYSRQLPTDILPEEEFAPSLFAPQWIETDSVKAQKVRASIGTKVSAAATELIETVFLSCLSHKEVIMLRFLRKGYREGSAILRKLGDPDVDALIKAQKHLGGEAHLLLGFVRFSDYDGMLAATITPKNYILPFIAKHFIHRFRNEDFLIYDKTHQVMLLYQNRQYEILPVDSLQLDPPSKDEQQYRALWKRFYKTIAIEARYNPKCRMTHMPKRYWENMTEVQDLL